MKVDNKNVFCEVTDKDFSDLHVVFILLKAFKFFSNWFDTLMTLNFIDHWFIDF